MRGKLSPSKKCIKWVGCSYQLPSEYKLWLNLVCCLFPHGPEVNLLSWELIPK